MIIQYLMMGRIARHDEDRNCLLSCLGPKVVKNYNQTVDYPKYRMFFLAKTSFATMIQHLPGAEADYIRNNPNRWVKYIVDDVMSQVVTDYPIKKSDRVI